MKQQLRFALKEILSAPLFILLCVSLCFLPKLAGSIGASLSAPPAAYLCLAREDAQAERLSSYLEEFGFLRCTTEEELLRAVSAGDCDCGIVIPEDLNERLNAGKTAGLLKMIRGATAVRPELYREQAAAALFAVYAPSLTAQALSSSDITGDEARERYFEMMDSGYRFSFTLKTEAGAPLAPDTRGERMYLAVLGLLLWLGSFFTVCLPLQRSTRVLTQRIGQKAAVLNYLLPGILIRHVLLLIVSAAALVLQGQGAYLPQLLLYLLLLMLYNPALLLLPGKNWQTIFCAFEAAFSLALCPIFADLSLLFPFIAKIRVLLPLSWFL